MFFILYYFADLLWFIFYANVSFYVKIFKMSFRLTLENFEGPIDLLLQMIEKRKMSISDISLAQISDHYIQFVQNLEKRDLSEMSHFLYIASLLTLIKSKSLLPQIELSEEEEEDIDLLKKKLLLLKTHQKYAQKLKISFSGGKKLFFPKMRKREIKFLPDTQHMKPLLLHDYLKKVIEEVTILPSKKKEASVKIIIHIEEMMHSLEARIQRELSFSFRDFLNEQKKEGEEEKTYRLVSFLALLELVKNGILDVMQRQLFDDIQLNALRKED